MEYTNIVSLVPEGEHFDASAINEGVWISQAHLDAIETKLGENATAFSGFNEKIETANTEKKRRW